MWNKVLHNHFRICKNTELNLLNWENYCTYLIQC